MATATKQFSYNVDLESWAFTANGATNIAGTRDTTEDSPNDINAGTGVMQTRRTGKNKSDGTPYWEWGNGTLNWESLGVPAGGTITAVNLEYDWKCSEYTTGASSTTGPAELRDGAVTSIRGTFSASQAFTATSAWATKTGTAITGLSDASTITIRLRLGAKPNTGNSTSAANTLRQDWVVVTITYNPPPTNPTISAASMADADRNWDTPSQDIAITFSESVDITPTPNVGDIIAGLTVNVNGGANAALTYVSGNATASWKVRRAELIQQNDSVVLDYSQATGIILAVDDNAELTETVDFAVTNNLMKRIRFTLRKSDNATVNSETVKYGIHEYGTGDPANADWMSRTDKGTTTTIGSGIVDVQYTGATAVAGTVYVVIVR